jgi:hypothetical protein
VYMAPEMTMGRTPVPGSLRDSSPKVVTHLQRVECASHANEGEIYQELQGGLGSPHGRVFDSTLEGDNHQPDE